MCDLPGWTEEHKKLDGIRGKAISVGDLCIQCVSRERLKGWFYWRFFEEENGGEKDDILGVLVRD